MKKKITIAAFLALVAGLVVWGAMGDDASSGSCPCAHHGRGFDGKGPGGPFRSPHGAHMAKALNLSTEQQAKIEDLRKEMEQDIASLRAALEEKEKRLFELWNAASPNRVAILAADAEIAPLRQKIHQREIEFRLDVLGILTPAQRAEHQQMMKDRGDHGHGFGPGWGMGPQ